MDPRKDQRADNGAPGGERSPDEGRPIFGRLPEFYREKASLLEPLVEVAEDLLAGVREALEREARRGKGPVRPWRERSGAGGWSRDGAGTAIGIARAFEERGVRAPIIWSGFEAGAHPSGGIEVRRARGSVVLVWEKVEGAPRPAPLEDADAVFPVSCRVHAVLLARLPAAPPRSGERLFGQLLWTEAP